MDYLLDTNTLSALIETNDAVVSRVGRIGAAEYTYSSVITEAELWYGVANAPDHKKAWLVDRIEIGLRAMAGILSPGHAAARAFADIKYYLKVTGQPLPDNDIWIAAVAIANDFTLVSHDAAFDRIPGLKLEDWLA